MLAFYLLFLDERDGRLALASARPRVAGHARESIRAFVSGAPRVCSPGVASVRVRGLQDESFTLPLLPRLATHSLVAIAYLASALVVVVLPHLHSCDYCYHCFLPSTFLRLCTALRYGLA